MTAATDFDRAVAKVLRWARKRDSFTRQQAWQANKNGSIRTSADLETVLGFLVDNDLLVRSTTDSGRPTVVYAIPTAVSDELGYVESAGAGTLTTPVARSHPSTQPATPNLATVTPISAANKEPLTVHELNEIRSWPSLHQHGYRARNILTDALQRRGHGYGFTDLRPEHFTVAEALELQRMVRDSR